MSNIVTLSGWGQVHNALASVVPDGAIHIDYSNFTDINDFFESIKDHNPDLVVGWSLGGQIALRAISEQVFKPKTLVLISAPYQFVVSKEIKCAMDKETFNFFYNSFEKDPVRAMKRFITLVGLNDSNIQDVVAKLKQSISTENSKKWLYWLNELEDFSCNMLDFSQMPKTFAIHGRDDTIIDVTQTSLFRSLIPNYKLEVFGACGHAPHLHDEARVREIIKSAL